MHDRVVFSTCERADVFDRSFEPHLLDTDGGEDSQVFRRLGVPLHSALSL